MQSDTKWKSTLQSLLCLKTDWAKDNDIENCYSCSSHFLALYRRKHHCRKCGYIFCAKCSQNFFNGTLISNKLEKKLRLCDLCFKMINDFYQKRNNGQKKSPKLYKPSFQQEEKDGIISLSSEQSSQLQIGNTPMEQSENKNIILQKIEMLGKHLFLANNIEYNQMQRLWGFVIEAVSDTRIETISNPHSLDICSYTKVKMILSKKTVPLYIQGVVTPKNVANRLMTTRFLNPKVLIFTTDIEVSSLSQMNLLFDEIVSSEKKLLKKIIDKIVRLSPNIILVQKNMLRQKGITVVMKIKSDLLDRIKKICKIRKKIDKIDKLDRYQKKQIIGTCSRLYFQNYLFQGKQITYMFVESDINPTLVSIILKGQDLKDLIIIKRITKQLLRIARHIFLQKAIIQFDKNLWKNTKIKQCFNQAGYIENFMMDNLSLNNFFLMKSLCYVKVSFFSTNQEKITDLKKLHNTNQYNLTNCYFQKKLDVLSEICDSLFKKIRFYGDDDLSLGYFIFSKIRTLQQKCKKCKRRKVQHVALYYHTQSILKISIQGKLREISESPATLKKSIKFSVFSFIRCNDCGLVLSDMNELKKVHLEFSFIYFIFELLNTKEKEKKQTNEKKCNHQRKVRVINYEEYEISFQVFKYKSCMISQLKFKSTDSLDIISAITYKHFIQVRDYQYSQLKKSKKQLFQQFLVLEKKIKTFEIDQKTRKKIDFEFVFKKLEVIVLAFEDQKLKECDNFLQVLQLSHQFYWKYSNVKNILNILSTIIKKGLKKRIIHEAQMTELSNIEVKKEIDEGQISSQRSLLRSLAFIQQQEQNQQWKLPLLDVEQNGTLSYIPVYEDQPVSIIAYGLNNSQPVYTQKFKVKVSFGYQHQQFEQLYKFLKEQKKDQKESQIQITIYYPGLFQQIRQLKGIKKEQYIIGAAGASGWSTTGGKRGTFLKSQDEVFIFKDVHQKEFNAFQKYVNEYAEYLKDKEQNGSLLAYIFGMYKISIKGKIYYYISMENLFFGLKNKLKVYDLKGSEVNRLIVPSNQSSYTGLDNNFKMDRNGEPIPIVKKDYQVFKKALKSDGELLANFQVIDYSLLLIIDLQSNKVRMGIIDYMRTYQLAESFETIYKYYFKNPGALPTVIEPNEYRDRFQNSLQKYFISVPQ